MRVACLEPVSLFLPMHKNRCRCTAVLVFNTSKHMHSDKSFLGLRSILPYPSSFIVGYRGIGQFRPVNNKIILSVESIRHVMPIAGVLLTATSEHQSTIQRDINPLQILSYRFTIDYSAHYAIRRSHLGTNPCF